MPFFIKRKHVVDSNGSLIKKPENNLNSIISNNSKDNKKINLKKRTGWFIAITVIILIVGIAAWLGIGTWRALANIITKNFAKSAPALNFLDKIDANQLQGEGDGRINILLLGMGGTNHPGGMLTDTIIVASIDPVNKKMAFLSIPRDLYVKIPGAGYNKINYAYAYGEQNSKTTGGGAALTKEVVSGILDLPIHYYIRLDFQGFTKFIDTIGGIDVNVEKALSDPYYPASNMVDYAPFNISAGEHHLNGETALKYARSRETTSDFDRSKRQQQVMIAAKDKALSVGVVTNPKKISEVLQILGDHLRTDIQTWEMEKIFNIVKDINSDNIISKVIDNSSDGLLTSGAVEGGYYLIPKAGIGNYKDIQKLAHEIFTDPYLAKENAKIEVLNGSGTAGLGTEVGELLKSYGYSVIKIEKNPTTTDGTVIYDYTNGTKPVTTKFLADRFKTQISNQPRPANSSSDIVLIIGKNYKTQNAN
ncbi:MAG: LCP family protein [Patescibacteria group bacterium]|nr:LCP family protein [Patescibacteria group bacterium]